jgi:GNAT superfamily N-acetyltransferase
VSVRAAGLGDAGALAGLRHRWRVLEQHEQGLDPAAFEEALAGWMAEHAASHFPFLAEADGLPVGMAWLAVVDRIPGPEFFVRQAGWVQSVYVVPEQRDVGAGSLLLQLLIERAEELGLRYLIVHPTERSYPFYERLGFRGTDRLLELRAEEGRRAGGPG